MEETLALRHGMIYDVGDDGRVAVTFLSNPDLDGQPVSVELVLVDGDDAERGVTLHVGDRFEYGGESWRLSGIDEVGTYDYTVHLVKEEASLGGSSTVDR
ncbi:DUF6406 domain-containing protein [Plantactinospora sp. GCM10030261]|uniref:DUF6406 domain-containing protein n=1 Tax=Plantactinospora sp. GCM10030261 TaxID=3273420 RepID=UPI00360CC19A